MWQMLSVAMFLDGNSLVPSCHFLAHIVSIIQMGSVGSIMAIAMFPKQMAPVKANAPC